MLRLADGPCSKEDQAKCQAEHEEFLDRACAKCPKIRPQDVNPYAKHWLDLYRLRRAGFPLAADDLSLKEWRILALVTEILDRRRAAEQWQRPAAT